MLLDDGCDENEMRQKGETRVAMHKEGRNGGKLFMFASLWRERRPEEKQAKRMIHEEEREKKKVVKIRRPETWEA